MVTWRDRAREAWWILRSFDRSVGLPLLLLCVAAMVPVWVIAAVADPGRAGSALVGTGVSAACALAAIPSVDRQIRERRAHVVAWVDPELRAAAARYRLTWRGDPLEPPLGRSKLLKAGVGFARCAVSGAYVGAVGERAVGIAGAASTSGALRTTTIAWARLEREGEVLVEHRPSIRFPSFAAPRPFDDTFKVHGRKGRELPTGLRDWLADEGRGFAYEVRGPWVLCKPTAALDLPLDLVRPADLGVWLAAAVGFAERWGHPGATNP